jgi:hypothetical protein
MATNERSRNALEVMRSGGLEPLEDYINNTTPWKCECLVCGRIVNQSLKSVQVRGANRKGCKHCAPNARISESAALEVMKLANLRPLEPFKNSASKWKCQCVNCGRTVSPRYNQIKQGQSGCAYCSGNAVDMDEAVKLFLENDLDPLVEYPGSGVPWKSIHKICGREVSPTYSNVRQGHSGCKYCVGNIADENKARNLFISRGLLPFEPYKNALVSWKSIHQQCGNIVTPRYNTVQQGSSGCGFCAGNKPITETQALELFESKNLRPLEPFPGTNISWKCIHESCGKTVFPRYSDVKQGGSGCKYCAGVFVDADDAVALFISKGLEPQEPYQNSAAPWLAIHKKCGRIVSPAFSSVNAGGSGCAYCAGSKISPEDAREFFIQRGLIPQVDYPGSTSPWESVHAQCGRTVYPKYSNVHSGSIGCKDCATNYVNPEFAHEVFRNADLEPLEPYPGSDVGWRSIHTVCGREVNPRYGYVRLHNAGCKYCSGKAISEDDAIAYLESRGFEPLESYPGSQIPWRMKHLSCGQSVSPRLNSLKYAVTDGEGCAKCADSTFNFSKPAELYLITHQNFGSHKIGIAGATKKRVDQHKRHGWTLVQKKTFETGQEAYFVEQEILSWFREELGIPIYLTKVDMPQGGFTETVDSSEIELDAIWTKVNSIVPSF